MVAAGRPWCRRVTCPGAGPDVTPKDGSCCSAEALPASCPAQRAPLCLQQASEKYTRWMADAWTPECHTIRQSQKSCTCLDVAVGSRHCLAQLRPASCPVLVCDAAVLLHSSSSRCNVQLLWRRSQRQPHIQVVHLQSTRTMLLAWVCNTSWQTTYLLMQFSCSSRHKTCAYTIIAMRPAWPWLHESTDVQAAKAPPAYRAGRLPRHAAQQPAPRPRRCGPAGVTARTSVDYSRAQQAAATLGGRPRAILRVPHEACVVCVQVPSRLHARHQRLGAQASLQAATGVLTPREGN
jgi:hypothetical protein